MASRIVDTAHTAATHRAATGDWDAVRHALAIGLDVDPVAELLYRDWINAEHRAGNRTALHQAIDQLNAALRTLRLDVEPATEQLLAAIHGKETPAQVPAEPEATSRAAARPRATFRTLGPQTRRRTSGAPGAPRWPVAGSEP